MLRSNARLVPSPSKPTEGPHLDFVATNDDLVDPLPTRTLLPLFCPALLQVYPVGIPLLYAFILWINRESLNPRIESAEMVDADSVAPRVRVKTEYGGAKESPEELEERLKKRMENPDLVPSMFLWKDFGEGNKMFQRSWSWFRGLGLVWKHPLRLY